MESKTGIEKWASFSTTKMAKKDEDEAQEEEEALSLCDFPNKEDHLYQSRKEEASTPKTQEDFDFCSLVKESEMCAADEVFFQGQILPLRPSVSSESCSNSQNASRCMSRSTSLSMERSYSSGFTSGSSRSSSIRSHQSSSSSTGGGGGSGGRGGVSTTTPNHRPRMRNHRFHSHHPSPKPQLKSSNFRNKNVGNSNNQKSTMWSLFRLGLLTPPEIDLQDLKLRSNNINNKAFRSSNSKDSNVDKASKKKKQSIFDKNGAALFGGCKCSADAIETVPSRVVTIRRSASLNDAYSHEEEDDHKSTSKGTNHKQEGKQGLSLHRTFEWLKQLSLEGQNSAVEEAA